MQFQHRPSTAWAVGRLDGDHDLASSKTGDSEFPIINPSLGAIEAVQIARINEVI